MFTPNQIVLETKSLAFGLKPPMTVSFELQMFEDMVGSNQTYTIQAPVAVPFLFSIESGTLTPTVTLTLDRDPSNFELGKTYTLLVNNTALQILFLFAEDYNPLNWRMSDSETTAGNSYHFKEIEHGTKILTKEINTKFKMMFESLSNMSFRITDFLGKMETKRRLRDIVECAIAGSYPKNCHATVVRESDGRITAVNLHYTEGEERFTRINYYYANNNVSLHFNDPLIADRVVVKSLLHRIEVSRVATEADNAPRRYSICTVQFYRETFTFDSVFGGTITMPMITNWDVVA